LLAVLLLWIDKATHDSFPISSLPATLRDCLAAVDLDAGALEHHAFAKALIQNLSGHGLALVYVWQLAAV